MTEDEAKKERGRRYFARLYEDQRREMAEARRRHNAKYGDPLSDYYVRLKKKPPRLALRREIRKALDKAGLLDEIDAAKRAREVQDA